MKTDNACRRMASPQPGRADRFKDRFSACKGSLGPRTAPLIPADTARRPAANGLAGQGSQVPDARDDVHRADPAQRSFVQLYMQARAAARQ